jgi:hypothetical protein
MDAGGRATQGAVAENTKFHHIFLRELRVFVVNLVDGFKNTTPYKQR